MRTWWRRIVRVVLPAFAASAFIQSDLAQKGAVAQGFWTSPAAELAGRIADILGPGQARLTVRNISSIPATQVAPIRILLEANLKTHGITIAGAESANEIKVTLSENSRERLWVAETGEGSSSQVAMVRFPIILPETAAGHAQMHLHKERFLGPFELERLLCFPVTKPPLLAVLESQNGLMVLKQGCLLALDRTANGFLDGKGFYHLDSAQPATRDPRGILAAGTEPDAFVAYFPGMACAGSFTPSQDPNRAPGEGWKLACLASDDPWPLAMGTSPPLKAFFNASRNYFTGVVTPSVGVNLPPFYSAAWVPRAGGASALLIAGIDSKVQLAENGALRAVAGTRDWGSDFAALNSGCGAGTQIIISDSGDAASDSLRAYELPSYEASPVSDPLDMEGTVTALTLAANGKSVLAVVRKSQEEYEVDRVTALCN